LVIVKVYCRHRQLSIPGCERLQKNEQWSALEKEMVWL
jgi:hypothetical protein